MTAFDDQIIRERVLLISYAAEAMKDAIDTKDEDRFRDLVVELSAYLAQIRNELNIPTPLYPLKSDPPLC